MSCALLRAYPQLDGRLPRLRLGEFPTAIERVTGLLPGDVELWVKRDDLCSPRYGGNKVRKLEFLLGGLRGDERLVTFGGYGSHHVLATARHAGARGHAVHAVLFPQPETPHVRATMARAAAAGARLFPARGYLGLPRQLLRALGAPVAGRRTVLLPTGGSSPLGTLGWWSGGLEIAAQVAAGAAPPFDAVYVALGSCGTAAGLWLGLGAAARALVGVRVVPPLVCNRWLLGLLAGRTRRLLGRLAGAQVAPPAPRLVIAGGQLGGGYGHETAAGRAARARAADAGLHLDATYTAKVMAALLDDAAAGRLAGRRVLFVHTLSATDRGGSDAAASGAAAPGTRGAG